MATPLLLLLLLLFILFVLCWLLPWQCWDLSLIKAVYLKLARELPHGALVVDYRPGLGTYVPTEDRPADKPADNSGEEPLGQRGACGQRQPKTGACNESLFEELASIQTPVSWSDLQRVFVFRKR